MAEISRETRKNRNRAGLRLRGTSAESLGARDARWRRNANVGAKSAEYGDGLDVTKGGVLFVDVKTLSGVVKDAEVPFQVSSDGRLTLDLGNALEVVKGQLAVSQARALDDSTAADVATIVADHNTLLERLRSAGFLER